MIATVHTRQSLKPYGLTLVIVAAATAVACGVLWFAPLDSVSAIYMLPVLLAAVRYGTGPAIFAALVGAFLTSLFYPPLFSPLVFEPSQLTDLATSLVVALTVGQLAGRLRAQMLAATEREQRMALIYALGRALAGAGDPREIFQLVADHLEQAMAGPVAVFLPGREPLVIRSGFDASTTQILAGHMSALFDKEGLSGETQLRQAGRRWLFQMIGGANARAVLVTELPREETESATQMRMKATALVGEANLSLDRLGLSRVVEERQLRQRTNDLREILVESVSHEMRTPLTGIVGAASVLSSSPPVASDTELAGLASGIEEEARRLDRLIENVIDLGRIRAGALQPRLEATDPCEIIDHAISVTSRRLLNHVVHSSVGSSLPFVLVDPVLISQALVNILENAGKYSEAGRPISIEAHAEGASLAILVQDHGIGLVEGETDLIFDRFKRGERHADVAGGSGLGLTIARVFVEACGGGLAASSAGPDQGTTLRLVLPIVQAVRASDDEE